MVAPAFTNKQQNPTERKVKSEERARKGERLGEVFKKSNRRTERKKSEGERIIIRIFVFITNQKKKKKSFNTLLVVLFVREENHKNDLATTVHSVGGMGPS